jgi:hypothetical protein
MDLKIIATILGSIGLISDIIGVAGIYYYKIKGLQRVTLNHINLQLTYAPNSLNENMGLVINELNRNIEATNEENKKIDKKTQPYFWAIVIGFVFQLISIWMSFSVSSTNSNSTSENNKDFHSKNYNR